MIRFMWEVSNNADGHFVETQMWAKGENTVVRETVYNHGEVHVYTTEYKEPVITEETDFYHCDYDTDMHVLTDPDEAAVSFTGLTPDEERTMLDWWETSPYEIWEHDGWDTVGTRLHLVGEPLIAFEREEDDAKRA